ncbi:hypothetical protein JZO70_11715 [Enterococcus sp. 669A]|uniref:Uncharacterized protein n=1 Tax=Candidatus Enterococcus moelleringii TaxID=2815325 RepID=A0ABS3LB14_9ENTE|nr:hypothetical protein [Enterococcus sp. 669A]MBO1306834.1 hypothetical protein [Enterococcus sp. 669A]
MKKVTKLETIVKHTTTKKELYDEIWDISAAGVARKYGIPYTQFLAQIKEASIPIPPSGYWAKLSSGKSVNVIAFTGNPEETIQLAEKIKQISYEEQAEIQVEPESRIIEEQVEIESELNPEIIDTITLGNQTYNYYDRSQLYEEVWDKPVTEVAKKYHVSDNVIRKVCKSLGIPTPPAGYWTKVRSGTKMKKTPLPKGNYLPSKHGLRNSQWIELEKGQTIEEKLNFLEKENLIAVLSVADQILLPDETEKFHSSVTKQRKSIVAWQKAYAKNLKKGRGKYNLDRPPMNADNLSEEGVQRMCRILDALIKALEPFDCQLLPDRACFLIDGEQVGYSFSEAQDKVPHVLTKEENMEMLRYEEEKRLSSYAYKPRIRKYDYHFNGKLSFKLCNERRFRDCKAYQLEDRLGEMIIALYEASEYVRQRRLEYEEAQRKREEEGRLREERKDRYNKEVELTIALLNEAEDFEKATRLRNYICAAEHSMDKDKFSDEWLAWAKGKADWLDPTVALEDDCFGRRNHQKDERGKQLEEKRYWY